MAHSDDSSEAVVEPVTDVDSAAAAIAQTFTNDEEEFAEEETNPEGNEEGEEADLDLEDEEDEADEGDEPETAIEAPVSLSAEAKAAFTNAPPEVQEVWAATENLRNTQAQEAMTRAADREKNAKAIAQHEARVEAATAKKEWLQQFTPQAPDPQMARSDPSQYIALKAQYDAEMDWYSEQETALTTEIEQGSTEAQQEFLQQRQAELSQIPEVTNEATRAEFFNKIEGVAKELGIPQEHLMQDADANDFKILRLAAGWKESHDELVSLRNKSKMKRVRAGKQRTMRPGAAQPQGSGNKAYEQQKGRLKQTGSVDDAAAIFSAQFAKGK